AKIDDTTDAAQIMGFLEQYLKKYPANYLWVHRRFKTRPEGEPTFYN
ncbi:MAG: lipid A biosynthesis acyltransferase, partial [Gammaproteobacteria bacterium CG22_combo_CG10-13_8_21_14_all_40_8]